MLQLLKKLFDPNKKEIDRLSQIVEVINSWEPELQDKSDEYLHSRTAEFKRRLQAGETEDDILPEAFAVVREAAKRVLHQRHYDVQLMGGIVLHEGRIAEMKTGEGKTLAATLPVYLNALRGGGVHVVTVNDYLARRDAEWMGPVYQFLGLSAGVILHDMNYEERRQAYNCDITYGTNNEFGFDYLRDNMILSMDQVVQRELNYAIIDEVDSILIDEARTPLIISGQADQARSLYKQFAMLVPRLKPGQDYTVDEKAKTVSLDEEGIHKVEQWLDIDNLYDDENFEKTHYLDQALKAHALFKRDRDYIVKDDSVIIVDEFTGRLMPGRRYSDGLHQAIEAKEGVEVAEESQTLAMITFQNYFRMYEKLAGMTGTAATEEDEFREIYGMDVVVIPTNEPMIREDFPDVVYKTEQAKFQAIVNEICTLHDMGRPVLVGTVSIEKSEMLSKMLALRGIPHQVLNAKYHEKEAEIIKQAGQRGTVTIATNMAGRGTDIVLGEGIAELGGLHILGTERHESRRIDNQLRGRAGRQGDPGSSRFYVSLEDDLMRRFGSERISSLMERFGWEDDQPVESPQVARAIERAQKKVESYHFDIRKQVLQFDDVMNQQREIIYEQRRRVLTQTDLGETVRKMIHRLTGNIVDDYCPEKVYPEEWDLEGLVGRIEEVVDRKSGLQTGDLTGLDRKELQKKLSNWVEAMYSQRREELGEEQAQELEKIVLLRTIDSKWMEHLRDMDDLRDGIGLRAYGQRDPLTEYKFEAHNLFDAMIAGIEEDVVRYMFRVRLVHGLELAALAQKRLQNAREIHNGEPEEGPRVKQRRVGRKIGRNDPCPCGSGKKYKKCCGR